MQKNKFQIRPMLKQEAETCEQILRSLPEWFGIEEAILSYRNDIETMETYVIEVLEEKEIVAFITLNQHNEFSAEIQVMAVKEEHHRNGFGQVLIEHAEQILRSRSTEYFEVKTLAPSRPNGHYECTRNFYFSVGFRPLEENKLWGDFNPCLIMIKYLPKHEKKEGFEKKR